MSKYIQTAPNIITNNGKEELYSIKSLFPNNDCTFSRLNPNDPNDAEFKTPRYKSSSYTVSTAISLQFANVFSTTSDYESIVMSSDVTLSTIKDNSANPNSIIESVYWGCALRFVYRVWDIKNDFNLNTSNVRLAVEAGMARSEFQAIGIGLDVNAYIENLTFLNPPSLLDRGDLVKLKERIFVDQKDTVEKYSVPLAVTLRNNIANSSKSAPEAIIFAMRNIKKRNSLSVAMNDAAQKGYDAIWVSKVYERVISNFSNLNDALNKAPTNEDIIKANKWLSLEKDIFEID